VNRPAGGAVLVPCERSPASLKAAWRAGLVARDLGVPLRLLHVHAAAADTGDTEAALRQLARDIGGHLGIEVDLAFGAGDPLAETVRAAREAVLVVIGTQRGNPLRELVLGTQAERLIRLCRVPVLVVKRPPTGAYRRVLAPVDLGPHAGAVIAAALRLSRGPGLEVLHALDVRDEIGMRACDVPEPVVRRHRQRAAQRARTVLQDVIAGIAAGGQRAVPAVGYGDAAAMVLARERAMRADLVVIGKRMRGLLADFFLGSVTQRVLAAARADVLVLPRPGRDDAVGTSGLRLAETAG
jgi:nucleotide-binding universal stress UspA family protein